jgi:hypothetical protein
MDIGITGLGRMGAGMAERWLRGGHRVVAHNRSRGPVDELAAKGADPAYSVEELVRKLAPPRASWIMLPAGDVTEGMIQTLIPLPTCAAGCGGLPGRRRCTDPVRGTLLVHLGVDAVAPAQAHHRNGTPRCRCAH